MKTKILFVDDDTFLLQGLRRILRKYRDEFEMEFANSGQEALERLAEKTFDVVVTDMRMPNMTGEALLEIVREKYPNIVRIILSGQTEKESLFRVMGPAHQFLSKPCDVEVLKSAISRIHVLGKFLSRKSIGELISGLDKPPCFPATITRLTGMLNEPDVNMQKVGQVISEDLALTTQVLRLVNSPFFGLSTQATDPQQAVNMLGINQLKPFIFSAGLCAEFNPAPELGLNGLSSSFVQMGALCKAIAKTETSNPELVNQVMLAGLVHKIGILLLAHLEEKKYRQVLSIVQNEEVLLEEAERTVFGSNHREVGAFVLSLWGLPAQIVEAVAFCRNPSDSSAQSFCPLAVVHFVSSMLPNSGTHDAIELDHEFLARIGLQGKVESWQSIIHDQLKDVANA